LEELGSSWLEVDVAESLVMMSFMLAMRTMSPVFTTLCISVMPVVSVSVRISRLRTWMPKQLVA